MTILFCIFYSIGSDAWSKDAVEENLNPMPDFKNPFVSMLPKKEIIVPKTEVTETPQIVQQPVITLPTLTITGLIWNSDRPQAIVNGQVVTIGDVIDGAKITKIDKNGIETAFGGQNFTTTMEATNQQTASNIDSSRYPYATQKYVR